MIVEICTSIVLIGIMAGLSMMAIGTVFHKDKLFDMGGKIGVISAVLLAFGWIIDTIRTIIISL